MELSLVNKRALVCGSSQGIGKAIAIELALLGADITLFARNEQSLKQVIGKLANNGKQNHQILTADFSKPEEVRDKIEAYIPNNRVHILVNNTGGPPAGPIHKADTQTFLAAYQSHLICNHILALACIPGMQQANYGRIINVISTSVRQPLKGLGVSNTTRAAVAAWAKTMSFELASMGITVNNVLPGATKTQRLENIISGKAEKTKIEVETIENEMLEEIPAKRFGDPSEIAALAAFLASPAAAYINGQSIAVDGGRTMAF